MGLPLQKYRSSNFPLQKYKSPKTCKAPRHICSRTHIVVYQSVFHRKNTRLPNILELLVYYMCVLILPYINQSAFHRKNKRLPNILELLENLWYIQFETTIEKTLIIHALRLGAASVRAHTCSSMRTHSTTISNFRQQLKRTPSSTPCASAQGQYMRTHMKQYAEHILKKKEKVPES